MHRLRWIWKVPVVLRKWKITRLEIKRLRRVARPSRAGVSGLTCWERPEEYIRQTSGRGFADGGVAHPARGRRTREARLAASA